MFFEQTTLDNGILVVSERMDAVRSVAIGVWFAVGSRDELPAESGMSHFLEHMMFKGTNTRSAADISQAFDGLGAELNAFTSKEYTCYYSRAVDRHLPVVIELLSDMVSNSLLAEDACVSEREVVIEEIARMEDTPDDRIHERFARILWPGHPLGASILGSRKSVSAFNHASTAAFKNLRYTTGNCVVAAVGSVEHSRLVELVERHLTLRPGPRSVRKLEFQSEPQPLSVLERDTEQSHICYGVTALNAQHEDRFALSIADTIFGRGMSSRLFMEIREKLGLAYAVYSFISLFQDTGQFAVYAGTRPANTKQVIATIQSEIDKLCDSGVTHDELDRAKKAMTGSLVLGLESTRNRMTRLGKSLITDGELLSIDELVGRIESVTVDDVARVTLEVFSGTHSLAVIGPYGKDDIAQLVG